MYCLPSLPSHQAVCVQYFDRLTELCEGENIGIFDPALDTETTAEERCCGTLSAGAYYDIVHENCHPCENGKTPTQFRRVFSPHRPSQFWRVKPCMLHCMANNEILYKPVNVRPPCSTGFTHTSNFFFCFEASELHYQ